MKFYRPAFWLLVCLCVSLSYGCIDIYIETIPEEVPASEAVTDMSLLDAQEIEQADEADSVLLDVEEETFTAIDVENSGEVSEDLLELDLSVDHDSSAGDIEEDIGADGLFQDLAEAGDTGEENDEATGQISCVTPSECTPNGWCVEGVCEELSSFPPCGEGLPECGEGEACMLFHCLPLFGAAICVEDEDCLLPGTVCEDGGCVNVSCVSQADCPVDTVCFEEVCVTACLDDEQCFGFGVCLDGVCRPPAEVECVIDSDCPGEAVCVDSECAIECVLDEDCGTGRSCEEGICT